ncbi:hypothetical protein JX265_000752 [Neoarthrinium moseri]|uniref:Formylmethionine deformylase-like protein n=1 Tax=Neoarthrinium moseri TaxID=1658444 RepID=A0A9Q0ATY7_9PEZI|nr:hypothetical protein JX265_000752 [Neoarthrinium moseri]
MAAVQDWSAMPGFQPYQSQSSTRSVVPKSQPATANSAPHHRTASDVSLSSQSQPDDTVGIGRNDSSVSATSQTWLPLHGVGASVPQEDGTDAVAHENAQPASHAAKASSPGSSYRWSSFHQPPPTASFPRRPKPSPMQFEERELYSYGSPAGSSQSAFSPRNQYQHSRTDSQARLITPTISDWARTPRSPPPYISGLPRLKKWWQWRPAWVMYIFLLFGFCCALGHHLFYASLHGRIADNQLAMLRYGTILSFAAKAGFVAAVVTAFRQRLWVTVRNKLLSVGALDSLFAATDDLSALWNIEVYQKARLAMLLAALVWLTPLVIILTSNTLLVELVENVNPTLCPGVRTLNFSGDELEDFRKPTTIDGLFGLAINYWNSTSINQSAPEWYDYYTGPSDLFQATASLGIFSHQVIGAKNSSLDICGSGWNCTYTVNFVAPGYKCTEQASGVGAQVRDLGAHKAPFGTDVLLPAGNFSYIAYTSGGDYATAQLKDVWPGGMPKNMTPPFPPNLGVFRTEPLLWVGYAVRVNPGETPNNNTIPGWDSAFVPKIFACENYETAYTVDFKYEGQDQFTTVTKRDFLYPVLDTAFVPGKDANDGTNDNTTATPENNYVRPYPMSDMSTVRRYRRVATFHSIGLMLRNVINGTMTSNPISNPVTNTKALQTKLLDPRQQFFPYTNLQGLVQELFEDIILTLFSNYRLVSLVWAAKPWETTGDLKGNDTTLYPCTKSRWENRFKYIARDLWIVYSCAFLCAVVAVVLGTAAVLSNEGRLYDTRFSSIVAATRGPALEKVMWKEDRGDLPPDVRNLRVGYGLIHRASTLGVVVDDTRYPERGVWEGGEIRYGFGLEGDVRQLRNEGSLFRARS